MFPGMLLKYFLLLFSGERTRKKTVQFLLHDGTNLSFSLLLTVGQCVRDHPPGFTYCSRPECSPEATGELAALQIPSPCKPPGQSTPCLTACTKADQRLPCRPFHHSISPRLSNTPTDFQVLE